MEKANGNDENAKNHNEGIAFLSMNAKNEFKMIEKGR